MAVRSEAAIRRRLLAYRSEEIQMRILGAAIGQINKQTRKRTVALINELEWVLGRKEFV